MTGTKRHLGLNYQLVLQSFVGVKWCANTAVSIHLNGHEIGLPGSVPVLSRNSLSYERHLHCVIFKDFQLIYRLFVVLILWNKCVHSPICFLETLKTQQAQL